ncbi:hypothetical protein P7C73_g5572, partial [Tremellales sp. Uapishka_1]
MSLKVDVAASEKARTEGNNAFKKGKWTESIGLYTQAALLNPSDPTAYLNRAQSYLKLDKFLDAEKDCTIALELEEVCIKGHYRRGLARKGLGKYEDALNDIKRVLGLEKGNKAALSEVDELEKLLSEARKLEEEKKRKEVEKRAVENKLRNDERRTREEDATPNKAKKVSEEEAQSTPASSFGALRKSRDQKKAFVKNAPEAQAQAANPSEAISSPKMMPTKRPPAPHTDTAAPSLTASTPPPPPDPSSTSLGSGILLVRKLAECRSAMDLWTVLCVSPSFLLAEESSPLTLPQYYPFANIPGILASLVEPDTLGQILLGLEYGSEHSGNDDGERVKVRRLMDDLRGTERWKMNQSMLSRSERAAGARAWSWCGGESVYV